MLIHYTSRTCGATDGTCTRDLRLDKPALPLAELQRLGCSPRDSNPHNRCKRPAGLSVTSEERGPSGGSRTPTVETARLQRVGLTTCPSADGWGRGWRTLPWRSIPFPRCWCPRGNPQDFGRGIGCRTRLRWFWRPPASRMPPSGSWNPQGFSTRGNRAAPSPAWYRRRRARGPGTHGSTVAVTGARWRDSSSRL